MPVAVLKIGRMYPNRPESCVDVVELRVMNRSSACAALIAKITNRKVTIRRIGDSGGEEEAAQSRASSLPRRDWQRLIRSSCRGSGPPARVHPAPLPAEER